VGAGAAVLGAGLCLAGATLGGRGDHATYWTSILFTVLGAQWVFAWSLAGSPSSKDPYDRALIRAFHAGIVASATAFVTLGSIGGIGTRAILLVVGAAWAAFAILLWWVRRPSVPLVARALLPPMDSTWLLLLPICAVDLLYVLSYLQASSVYPSAMIVWIYFGSMVAVDVGVHAVGIYVCIWLFRTPWAAIAFAAACFFARLLDASLFYSAGTLFEAEYLALITPYSVGPFLRGYVLFLLLVFPAFVAVAGVLIVRRHRTLRPLHALRWAGCIVLVVGLDLPGSWVATARPTAMSELDGVAWDDREAAVREFARNSAVRLVRELVAAGKVDLSVEEGTSRFRTVIESFELPMGRRALPPVPGITRFDRIVFIPVESLSLDLLPAGNESLPQQPSGFYSRPEIQGRIFTNVHTTALPTMPGLAVTFNSHPNPKIPLAGRHQNSFVRLLAGHGYTTVFLRSASVHYGVGHSFFEQAGFQRQIGREDFQREAALRPHIAGWGLNDRLLFDRLVSLLHETVGQRVFITVLGVDTHLPLGRDDYGDLEYPPLPELTGVSPASARLLRSVYRHEFDIGRLFDRLRDEGLWNDDLLVILSADHGAVQGEGVLGVPGYPRASLARIPLLFLTPQSLPPVPQDALASQLDLAPTLFHLLNFPIPEGWWGDSLFNFARRPQAIGVFGQTVFIRTLDRSRRISLDRPKGERKERFVELFRTLVIAQD
jgi:hypothetical protein